MKQLLLTPSTYSNLFSDTINPFKPDDNYIRGDQIHIRNKSLIKISDIKILKQKYKMYHSMQTIHIIGIYQVKQVFVKYGRIIIENVMQLYL